MRFFNKSWGIALTVAAVAAVAVLAPQGSIKIEQLQTKAAQAKSRMMPQLGTYDGVKLYDEVFALIRDGHVGLGESARRNDFVAVWQNKFAGKKVKDIPNFALEAWKGQYDDSLILSNQVTADHAIDLMLLSVGFLHDSYMRDDGVEAMGLRSDPSFAGVGVEITIRDADTAFKALNRLRPKDLKDKAAWAEYRAKYKAHLDEFGTISIAHPLYVANPPIEGSPGLAAGLRKGDAIIAVAQDPLPGKQLEWVPLAGKTTNQAVELIRGKIDTKVHLKIQRADTATGETSESVFTITRGRITPKVATFKDLGDCVSYVSLNDFMSQFGPAELKKAFDQAIDNAKPCNGAGGMVLNLRNNSGGFLPIAYYLEAMLMEKGTVLVTKERSENGFATETFTLFPDQVILSRQELGKPDTFQSRVFKRNVWTPGMAGKVHELPYPQVMVKPVLPKTFKVVALINSGSASASEVVAGTLQGERLATIMGEPSFGKGEVNTIIPLMNGGRNVQGKAARMLRLTSAEFLPSGTSMNHVGIIPDIIVEYEAAPDGKDWIWDSQVTAAKAELLKQLAAQASMEALRTKMGIEKRKLHDNLFQNNRHFIETGKRLEMGPEEDDTP